MKRLVLFFLAIPFLCGCVTSGIRVEGEKTLVLKWQRVVGSDGWTCKRCAETDEELAKAAISLARTLKPLGVQVNVVRESIAFLSFVSNPLESNRIWVGGLPLEEWLGAEIGENDCPECSAKFKKTVSCRTIEISGTTYEIIPGQLIVKAGLLAAADFFPGTLRRNPMTGEWHSIPVMRE